MMKSRQPLVAALGLIGALAACGGSPGLGASGGRDAASVGSGGASARGGSGSDGGATGSGGATAPGGGGSGAGTATGRGGVTSSGGVASSGGASGGVTSSGGASGGVTGATGGTGSGGKLGSGGTSGIGGVGGKGSDTTGRDAGPSYDVPPEGPRADASLPDRAADTSRTDALSAAAQEYVKVFAEPYCARLAECCVQQGFPTSGLGPCEANELLFVKNLDDGSTVIDPTTIQTILSQLQNSCDQPAYILLASTTKGTRLAGEACEAVNQCASDPALCLSSAGASSGKCLTPPRGKAGDGCAGTCDDVSTCKSGTSEGKSPYSACYEQDGLRCDMNTYTCVPLTAPGAKCTDFSECGDHAECTNGTCVAKAKLGAACGNGKICDSGLQCGSSGGSAYTCQKLSVAWSGSCSP